MIFFSNSHFFFTLQKYPKDFIGVGAEFERSLATLLQLLAPLCPMFAGELWTAFSEAPAPVLHISHTPVDTTSSDFVSFFIVDLFYIHELIILIFK